MIGNVEVFCVRVDNDPISACKHSDHSIHIEL